MNKSIKFNKTTWKDIFDMAEQYLYHELNNMNDGFHHDFMMDAEPYTIEIDGEICGFFSMIDGWDGGVMLTSFYVQLEKRAFSADVLDVIMAENELTAALVPSNDGNFVSIAFEKMHSLGTTFNMQAYNHVYGGKAKRPAEFGAECFEEVKPEEYEHMNELTDKQWDGCYGSDMFRFYAIRKDGDTLGYGAICALRGKPDTMDIGNFTLPEHRRKGVGRSMLMNLANVVINEGKKVVAGCWYYNKESIPTLKSSGFIPANRIFYVKFIKENEK